MDKVRPVHFDTFNMWEWSGVIAIWGVRLMELLDLLVSMTPLNLLSASAPAGRVGAK